MKRLVRSLILLPLLAVVLVAVPAVLLTWIGHTPAASGQTVPPPTPGTIPSTPRPTRIPPRATAIPPRGTVPMRDLRVRANGMLLEQVIGDRLSDTIYGYTQSGRLVRTDDNGVSWALITTRPEVDEFLMSAADPDVLYTGGPLLCFDDTSIQSQPFARSDDGGVRFLETEAEPLNEPILHPLVLHPVDALTLIAAGCDGLYESFDGGESWLVLSRTGIDGIPSGYVVQEIAAAYAAVDAETPSLNTLYAVATDAENHAIVLFSDDGGRTWEVISPDMGDMSFRIRALTIDPETVGRLWFAASSGVWSTEDLGQFWGFSNRGLMQGTAINDILLHPTETVLLGTEQGLYGKDVEASRWSKLGDATFQRLAIDSLLFNDFRSNRLWLNADDGVYVFTLR